MLILGHALPWISSIALAKDLSCPKHGAKHVASYFFCAFGSIVFSVCGTLDTFNGQNVPEKFPVLVCILSATMYLVLNFYWVIPVLLVSSWMEKFICLSEGRAIRKEVLCAKRCLKLYSDFERGFGLFFFFVFGVTQVYVIFSMFLTISKIIGANGTVLYTLIYSVGNIATPKPD